MNPKDGNKLTSKTGSITADDYEDIVVLVTREMKSNKQFSAKWSKWATIKQKLEKKISQLHKKEAGELSIPTKIKHEKTRWHCISCGTDHDKVERKLVCPSCKSEDIITMEKYLTEEKVRK